MSVDVLKSVFMAALTLPPDTDVVALRYRDVAEWDSVSHLNLASAIEQAFNVMLETEDVIGLNSFSAAREILRKHGVQFA